MNELVRKELQEEEKRKKQEKEDFIRKSMLEYKEVIKRKEEQKQHIREERKIIGEKATQEPRRKSPTGYIKNNGFFNPVTHESNKILINEEDAVTERVKREASPRGKRIITLNQSEVSRELQKAMLDASNGEKQSRKVEK